MSPETANGPDPGVEHETKVPLEHGSKQGQAPEPSPPTDEPTSGQAVGGQSGPGEHGPGSAPFAGRDPLKKDVFCPVLGALVRDGQLKPEADGRIKIRYTGPAMARGSGFTLPYRWFIMTTSPLSNKPRDIVRNLTSLSFDLYRLRGGGVSYKGDSGILNSGSFDEEKFAAFVAHSRDGKTMTIADFGRAAYDVALRDGRTSANVRALANYATIIISLGYDDQSGIKRIDIQTLRDLYQHKQLAYPYGGPSRSAVLHALRVMREMGRSAHS